MRAVFAVLALLCVAANGVLVRDMGVKDWYLQKIGIPTSATYLSNKDVVLGTADGIFSAVDVSGNVKWRHFPREPSTPAGHVIVGEALYTLSIDDAGVVLTSVNLKTGILKYQKVVRNSPSPNAKIAAVGGAIAVIDATATLHKYGDGEPLFSASAVADFTVVDVVGQSTGELKGKSLFLGEENAAPSFFLLDRKTKEVSAVQSNPDFSQYATSTETSFFILSASDPTSAYRIGYNDAVELEIVLVPIESSHHMVGFVQSDRGGNFVVGRAAEGHTVVLEETMSALAEAGVFASSSYITAMASKKEDYAASIVNLEKDGKKIHVEGTTIAENMPWFGSDKGLAPPGEADAVFAASYPIGNSVYAVVAFTDGTVIATANGKELWSKDESLAYVEKALVVETPAVRAAGTVEEEDAWTMLVVSVQDFLEDVQSMVKSVLVLSPLLRAVFPHISASEGVERKAKHQSFGFDGVAVLTTKMEKVVALDAATGEHLWSVYHKGGHIAGVIKTRTAAQWGMEVAVVVSYAQKGVSTVYWFDAVSGKVNKKEEVNYIVDMVSLFDTIGDNHRYPLVLYHGGSMSILPAPTEDRTKPTVFYTVDKKTGVAKGWSVKVQKGKVEEKEAWLVNFAQNGETVVEVATTGTHDGRIQTPGRAIGDGSVLRKYLVPALVSVLTLKDRTLTLYVINAATGGVIASRVHQDTKAPFTLSMTENVIVYGFVHKSVAKVMHRLESIELFEEGKKEWDFDEFSKVVLSSDTEKRSAFAVRDPQIMAKSFVVHAPVKASTFTTSHQGITTKQFVSGFADDRIHVIDRRAIDPRRPEKPTDADKEEGLMPYMPFLGIDLRAHISYNLTIAKLAGITSAPSERESTSVIFAWGHDLFCTAVTPARSYDKLNDDFNYSLLAVMTIALIVATFVLKSMAASNNVKMAWS